ncbi:hypothetical protein ANRL1_00389 [Anaerolineae bacterium]|nr:hypothetical protein ANRL1_00389 [Anaerolineae bacterium]
MVEETIGHASRANLPYRRLALLALILLATALRFYRLAAQDIWGDEAFSIFLSQQPLATVIAGGADTHPPLYPVLLFAWLRVAGESAFATRALSAFIGVLAVPLIFVFARRLTARPRVAWLAAILTTVSPLLIYYSQETRMYELVAVLSLASAYCLTSAMSLRGAVGAKAEIATKQSPTSRMSLLRFARNDMWSFLLSTLLAMYTHYSAFFFWVAENIFVAMRLRTPALAGGARENFSSLTRWAILQIALLIAYVPWIIVQMSFLRGKASARFDEWSWRGIEMIFGKTFLAFSAGLTLDYPLPQMIAVVFLVFAALGILVAARDASRRLAFAPLYFLTPVAIAFAINPIMPFFFERYVLVALPGFYVTVALGLDYFARRSPLSAIAVTAAFIIASAYSLGNFYFNDAYAKGMYGQMMAYLAQNAQPGDALILNNPLQKPLYRYYAPRDIPAFYFPDGTPLEDPQTRQAFENVATSHPRVWLVMFGNPQEYDPTGYLERWLGAHAYKSFFGGFVDASLTLYEMPNAQTAIQRDARATLGDLIRFVGYTLNRADIAPGQTLQLTLQWQTTAPINQRYKVFAHIIGAFNPATQSPVWAQMDGEPVGGSRPTTAWLIGETIDDRYGLLIPRDTPPGDYEIEIGMYDPATLARLPVFDIQGNRITDNRVILGKVRVIAR